MSDFLPVLELVGMEIDVNGDRPLRPATCQSVRMQFMAMTPGVHPVETLTLTDVETGYSVSLR